MPRKATGGRALIAVGSTVLICSGVQAATCWACTRVGSEIWTGAVVGTGAGLGVTGSAAAGAVGVTIGVGAGDESLEPPPPLLDPPELAAGAVIVKVTVLVAAA